MLFDTISICLSKGLGAPVGSLLIGTKKDMDKALRIRKLFGGGMRQAGYLASAAIYALDNNVQLLKEDHTRAKELSDALVLCSIVHRAEPVETNIVIFYLNEGEDELKFIQEMKNNNIFLIGMGEGKLRFVIHLDYTKEMHYRCLEVIDVLGR